MFNFVMGFIVALVLAVAAIHPDVAKRFLGGAVDSVHAEYKHQTQTRAAEAPKAAEKEQPK